MTTAVYSCFLPFSSSNLCGHFECISFQFFNDFYLLTYMPILTVLFIYFCDINTIILYVLSCKLLLLPTTYLEIDQLVLQRAPICQTGVKNTSKWKHLS